MNAKKFKELVATIPDDAELEFTYSMFLFKNAGLIFKEKEIVRYFKDEGYEYDGKYKNHYMIEFNN